MAIRTWACERTRDFFLGRRNKVVPPDVASRAKRKLLLVHAAADIEFLRTPPGNRLEKLRGDRADQWSIRINARFRVCFVFRDGDAYQVEIVDYH